MLSRQTKQLFDKYACWVWFGSALFGVGVGLGPLGFGFGSGLLFVGLGAKETR